MNEEASKKQGRLCSNTNIQHPEKETGSGRDSKSKRAKCNIEQGNDVIMAFESPDTGILRGSILKLAIAESLGDVGSTMSVDREFVIMCVTGINGSSTDKTMTVFDGSRHFNIPMHAVSLCSYDGEERRGNPVLSLPAEGIAALIASFRRYLQKKSNTSISCLFPYITHFQTYRRHCSCV